MITGLVCLQVLLLSECCGTFITRILLGAPSLEVVVKGFNPFTTLWADHVTVGGPAGHQVTNWITVWGPEVIKLSKSEFFQDRIVQRKTNSTVQQLDRWEQLTV